MYIYICIYKDICIYMYYIESSLIKVPRFRHIKIFESYLATLHISTYSYVNGNQSYNYWYHIKSESQTYQTFFDQFCQLIILLFEFWLFSKFVFYLSPSYENKKIFHTGISFTIPNKNVIISSTDQYQEITLSLLTLSSIVLLPSTYSMVRLKLFPMGHVTTNTKYIHKDDIIVCVVF